MKSGRTVHCKLYRWFTVSCQFFLPSLGRARWVGPRIGKLKLAYANNEWKARQSALTHSKAKVITLCLHNRTTLYNTYMNKAKHEDPLFHMRTLKTKIKLHDKTHLTGWVIDGETRLCRCIIGQDLQYFMYGYLYLTPQAQVFSITEVHVTTASHKITFYEATNLGCQKTKFTISANTVGFFFLLLLFFLYLFFFFFLNFLMLILNILVQLLTLTFLTH